MEFNLEVCSWRHSSDSCARLWSSAKSNSLRASGSKLASFVILSMYMMNNNGDNTQPCLTPDVMSNQSVSPPDVRIALILFAYMARMLSKSWPWMLYSSSVCPCSLCQTPLPGQQIRCLVLCRVQLLLLCLKAKIVSVQPVPFLKPICAWLRNGSTLYLVRCSRTLAHILPTWLSREMPLYIPQSLLLPFFFHIGTMTARCQSSGTFLSIHAFWKMEVSQVMPISPLARMANQPQQCLEHSV